MNITLLFHTPLSLCVNAGRTCWQSYEKGGCYSLPTDQITEADRNFLHRILNKNKHGSVAEHLYYNFAIDGISRACLQELARHRHSSFSVKSSRYTLKELKNDQDLTENASKYLVMTGNDEVDSYSIEALKKLQSLILMGVSNDLAKYAMPESYKTSLAWSVNARALQNFLSLRSSPNALWEIQKLAFGIFEALPSEHQFLFQEVMQQDHP